MPFFILLRAASFFLKQQPWGEAEGVTLKVFVRRGSWLRFLPPVVWQTVSDFFLPSLGLVWVYSCTFPQHSPHHCWYCADPAHTGEVRVTHPSSWGGQHHPDQGQILAPQVPGHHRHSANDEKIVCMQRVALFHSALEGHHYKHIHKHSPSVLGVSSLSE